MVIVVLLCIAFGIIFFAGIMTIYVYFKHGKNSHERHETGVRPVKKGSDLTGRYYFKAYRGGLVLIVEYEFDLVAEDYSVTKSKAWRKANLNDVKSLSL